MGYGTLFTTDIYLNRQIFNSRHELDDKIKELENMIELKEKSLPHTFINKSALKSIA